MLPGTDRTQVLMPSGGGPPGMIGYRTTRYARCVTPSVSVSPVCSSSIRCGNRSKRRRPPPSRTLTRWIRISSTRPAARNCWSTLAPMSPIRLSPAISWGLRQSALDPVGDEGEHRVRARGRPVGDHEARDIAKRTLATPGLDRVVVTSAAHDHRARFLDQVAVHPLEHRRVVERPVVESHPVLAQPLLGVVVGRRDVAVQRHAHVDDHVAHLLFPLALLCRAIFPRRGDGSMPHGRLPREPRAPVRTAYRPGIVLPTLFPLWVTGFVARFVP